MILKRAYNGKAKIDLKTNKYIITTLCNNNIKYENLSYKELIDKIKHNNLDSIDFKDKDIQKNYIYFTITENNDIDNPKIP